MIKAPFSQDESQCVTHSQRRTRGVVTQTRSRNDEGEKEKQEGEKQGEALFLTLFLSLSLCCSLTLILFSVAHNWASTRKTDQYTFSSLHQTETAIVARILKHVLVVFISFFSSPSSHLVHHIMGRKALYGIKPPKGPGRKTRKQPEPNFVGIRGPLAIKGKRAPETFR